MGQSLKGSEVVALTAKLSTCVPNALLVTGGWSSLATPHLAPISGQTSGRNTGAYKPVVGNVGVLPGCL